jgi:hypothetical protein
VTVRNVLAAFIGAFAALLVGPASTVVEATDSRAWLSTPVTFGSRITNAGDGLVVLVVKFKPGANRSAVFLRARRDAARAAVRVRGVESVTFP